MPMSQYPNGFTSGVVVQDLPLAPAHGAKVFYVGNNATLLVNEKAASDGNKGTFLAPFSTIDYAIGQTAANRGDIIYVRPNHTTTVTAADAIDADVAGISIIGLGNGMNRPLVDYTNAAGEFVVGADNVRIENFRFLANVTAVLKAIDIEASVDDTVIKNNLFYVDSTGTDEFNNAIILNTNNKRTVIEGNEFDMGLGGAVSAIYMDNSAAADEATKIVGNLIMGDYSTANIVSDTTASNDILIHNNILVNGESDNLNTVACISLVTLSSGVISDNKLVCNVATPDLSVVADQCVLLGNSYSETVAGAEEPLYTPRVPDSTYNFIGVDDSNNVASTSNVTANEDGSILERLEQIQEAINNGTGTAIATNKSIVDLLGTTGSALVDDALSVVGILGVNDADNAFASTNVVANVDGSILERNEVLQVAAAPSKSHPNYFTVTADMTSATWNTVAAHEIATVTGMARLQIIVEVTATVVTTGTNGTIALGFAGNTSAIFSATALDAALTGDIFSAVVGSAATTPVGGAEAQSSLTHAIFDVVALAGTDVGYTIATNAGTTGTLTFHVWWQPLDATGAVVAGAGGVL